MARVGGWMGATLNRHTSGVGCSGIHPIPDQKVGYRVGGCEVGKSRLMTRILPIYWSFCPLPTANLPPSIHRPRQRKISNLVLKTTMADNQTAATNTGRVVIPPAPTQHGGFTSPGAAKSSNPPPNVTSETILWLWHHTPAHENQHHHCRRCNRVSTAYN
jgi:hypothetical protein